VGALREAITRREAELGDGMRQALREKQDKLDQYKAAKKNLQREAEELKGQLAITANKQTAHGEKYERLLKDLEAAKIERSVLQSQVESYQQQRDEQKLMYETLLGVVKQQNAPQLLGALVQSQESADNAGLLRQRMLDLEQSIQVLRTFKQLYRATAEFKCGGCLRSFKPVLFKAHHLTCSKLLD
jgi:chromosome segregation ATPase